MRRYLSDLPLQYYLFTLGKADLSFFRLLVYPLHYMTRKKLKSLSCLLADKFSESQVAQEAERQVNLSTKNLYWI